MPRGRHDRAIGPAPQNPRGPFVKAGAASLSGPKPLRVSEVRPLEAPVMTILSVLCLVTGATLAGIAPKRSVQQAAPRTRHTGPVFAPETGGSTDQRRPSCPAVQSSPALATTERSEDQSD